MYIMMVIGLIAAIVPAGALIVGVIEKLDKWMEDRE